MSRNRYFKQNCLIRLFRFLFESKSVHAKSFAQSWLLLLVCGVALELLGLGA